CSFDNCDVLFLEMKEPRRKVRRGSQSHRKKQGSAIAVGGLCRHARTHLLAGRIDIIRHQLRTRLTKDNNLSFGAISYSRISKTVSTCDFDEVLAVIIAIADIALEADKHDLAAAELHTTGDGFVRTRIDRLPGLAVIGGAERIATHAEHHHAAILHAEATPIGAFILRLDALEAHTVIGGAINDAKLGSHIEI